MLVVIHGVGVFSSSSDRSWRTGLAQHPDARAEHWAGEMYRNGMGVSFGVMAVRAPFEALVRPLAEEALRRGRGAV